ncbi:hypothetical protein GLOIN_2v1791249 [Rhizophagus clarus]|nr:hypothetical protein GLOIN_2v1791249 [Rhizophagus clarus]
MFFNLNSDFIKVIAAIALVGTVLYYRNKKRKDVEKKKPSKPKEKSIFPEPTDESTITGTSLKEKPEETPLLQDSSDIPNKSEENSTDKW